MNVPLLLFSLGVHLSASVKVELEIKQPVKVKDLSGLLSLLIVRFTTVADY